MSESERQEADQLPEEAPEEQVTDDDQQGGREGAEKTAGVPGESGQATGNPDNAG